MDKEHTLPDALQSCVSANVGDRDLAWCDIWKLLPIDPGKVPSLDQQLEEIVTLHRQNIDDEHSTEISGRTTRKRSRAEEFQGIVGPLKSALEKFGKLTPDQQVKFGDAYGDWWLQTLGHAKSKPLERYDTKSDKGGPDRVRRLLVELAAPLFVAAQQAKKLKKVGIVTTPNSKFSQLLSAIDYLVTGEDRDFNNIVLSVLALRRGKKITDEQRAKARKRGLSLPDQIYWPDPEYWRVDPETGKPKQVENWGGRRKPE